MRRREDGQLVHLAHDLAGERVQVVELLDLVAEELEPDRELLVGGDDLERVAPDPERAALERDVVARVADVDQAAQQRVAVELAADLHPDRTLDVFLRGAQAVDRGDGGDHDDVAPGEQRHRRRVPQPLDLLVDRGVLLDVGVRLRDVRLGLVVVVVADEVFDGVVGQQLAELLGELRAQRLVGCEDERGPLQLLDEPRGRRALAGAGGAEQDRVAIAAAHPSLQLDDGRGLVTGRLVVADDLEGAVESWDVERHGTNRTSGV